MDDYGAFLTVVDNKGKTTEANYLAYSGAVQNLLRSVEQIQDKNSFVIDWEKPNSPIYLAEHNYLIDQLRRVDNVVNKAQNRLTFPKDVGHIRIQLESIVAEGNLATKNKLWQSRLQLFFGRKPTYRNAIIE